MKTTVLLAVLAFSSAAVAASNTAPDELISKLLAEKEHVEQSVHVVRLSDGKTLYDKTPDRLVSPASVTKLVTAAAVLAKFTPAHTFKTRFYYSGQRKNDRILGDLIVEGDGDPFIVSEKLWQLAADIKHMGIREFSGDLIIDNSLFSGGARDSSRQSGAKQSRHAYDAPVSAFGVNFNTFAVAIAPGDGPGKPAFVSVDPYPLRGLVVDNKVRTGIANSRRGVDVKRIGNGRGEEKLIATGNVPADAQMTKLYRAVGDHVISSGEYLKSFLQGAGVVVAGKVKEGRRPPGSRLFVEMESYEMRKIISGLNVFSNNYIADVLVKRLGAAFPKAGEADAPGQGSYENGLHAISDFLRKDVGITSEFVLENGSGLATENRLSARQITTVLSYMERHMEVFPEFLGSLPATGWDGTLRRRFGSGGAKDMKGLFRAKTGTLSQPISVASLAGYFRHPKHGMLAFSILENGIQGRPQPAIAALRERQDRVLVAFMNEL